MSGGHGATNALAGVKEGIEIWMRKLNSVAIASDGETATIGGGTLAKEVTDALWPARKQTSQPNGNPYPAQPSDLFHSNRML